MSPKSKIRATYGVSENAFKKTTRVTASTYADKRRFGRVRKGEDSGSDDEPELVGKTPNTRRKIKEDIIKAEIKKLGFFETFLTLIKGFIATSILYNPKSFRNGGWLWTTVTMVLSCILTTYCAMLLLQIRDKTGLTNYSEIG